MSIDVRFFQNLISNSYNFYFNKKIFLNKYDNIFEEIELHRTEKVTKNDEKDALSCP